MDDVAYLIQQDYTEDGLGQHIPNKETSIEIFVSVQSISRTEYFEAGKNGLMPEIVIKTAAINYSGEKLIEYQGVRYGIYRTYRSNIPDEVELYLQRKAGAEYVNN